MTLELFDFDISTNLGDDIEGSYGILKSKVSSHEKDVMEAYIALF
jgi:hypothetical protein